MKILLFIMLAGLIASQGSYGQSNVWKGITPLRSTRADVEKMLGGPEKGIYHGDAVYQSEKGRITVNYAQKRCDRGWDVPAETVLSIKIPPSGSDANKSAEELKIEEAKYFISGDDAFYGTWTNPDIGIQYYFMNMSRALQWITYIPARADNSRRCDGFPAFVPEGQHYAYESRLFYNPKAGKDGGMDYIVSGSLFNMIYQAKQAKGKYTPYAVVYFNQALPYRTYRKRLARLRLMATRIAKMESQDVQIIEGGMNRENRIEFYLLPKDYKPPAPDPMLPSPQFMRKGSKSQ